MCRKYFKAIARMLVVVMSYSPSMAFAQPEASAERSQAKGKMKIDIGFITPNTAAAIVLYPRHVLTAPQAEMLPTEVIAAAGKKYLGIDPLEIEQLVAIGEPPQAGPARVAVVLHMAHPLDEGKILAPLWDRSAEAQLDGKIYRRGMGPMDFSIFRPDDRTLMVANDTLLREIVGNRSNPKEGQMSKILGRIEEPPDAMAILLIEPIRPLLAMPLAMTPVPPPFSDAKKIPDLLTSVGAKVNLTGDFVMSLALKANDEAAAEQLEQIIDKLLEGARQATAAEVAKQSSSDDPVEQANAQYAKRISDRMLQAVRPVRKGQTLTLATNAAGKNPQMVQVATIGVLVALLLPAVQAARGAARRAQTANNMKQILLAMLNYEAMNHAFPARANFDKQGKPLLSWRVHLLPLLDHDALYRRFHLDEPWDSEHNRTLIPMMPAVYQNPNAPARPGMAHYLAVCGEGLAFDGTQGRALRDFRDGTSNTILIVEANNDRAVIWTKPDDWQYDAQHPMAGLGTAHPGGFNVGLADGSVRFISNGIDPELFHALLTIAGGEPIPPGSIR